MPEILISSISCILLVMITTVAPVHLPRFSIFRIPSVLFSLLLLFLFSGLEKFLFVGFNCLFFLAFLKGFIHFLQLSVCLFLDFFKEFIHFF